MKKNLSSSLLGSLIVIGIIFGVFYLFFLFSIFSLAGGETLGGIEAQRLTLLILTLALVILAMSAVVGLRSKGRKYTATGIAIPSITALLFAVIFYAWTFNYHTAFDKSKWLQHKSKPFDMTATLVKENKLIGLSRAEVKQMLGSGQEYPGAIIYYTQEVWILADSEWWTFSVIFKNDKVVENILTLPSLGV